MCGLGVLCWVRLRPRLRLAKLSPYMYICGSGAFLVLGYALAGSTAADLKPRRRWCQIYDMCDKTLPIAPVTSYNLVGATHNNTTTHFASLFLPFAESDPNSNSEWFVSEIMGVHSEEIFFKFSCCLTRSARTSSRKTLIFVTNSLRYIVLYMYDNYTCIVIKRSNFSRGETLEVFEVLRTCAECARRGCFISVLPLHGAP